jgi:HlyD family secretion protein
VTRIFVVLVALGILGGGGWYYVRHHQANGSAQTRFRTVKLERGEVVEGVNASGTIQPFKLVQVGTQVSGAVEKLMKDFNDKCEENEVIALIDSRKFVAQVDQDKATLGKAAADVAWKRALLEQAVNDLKRNEILWAKKLIADSDLDGFRANEGSLRGQLADAMAVVSQSQAQLDQDEINLKYCTIISPVKGSIVSRNVDVGQTVAASLQAPTLFVIANDLRKMQVQASVPEADVGKILDGQRVPFTVDAYPEHVFEGVVSQVRLQSTTVQNVVTYTVMVDLDNPPDAHHPDGMLLPGMTANATFEIAKSSRESLHVMSTALRFEPPVELLEPEARAKAEQHGKGRHGGGQKPSEQPSDGSLPAGGAAATQDAPPAKKHIGSKRARLYVKNAEGLLKPVPVKTGVSDGAQVEVTPLDDATKLDAGSEIVIGVQQEEEEQSTNPFAPRMPGGGGGGGRGMR